MALNREAIVDEALALLDEVGLDGVSLRKLADRLGVQAPSLYWHVKDKRQLLDWMAEAIVGRSQGTVHLPEPDQPWWDWLANRARFMREALLRHRDGALVVSGNRPTAAVLPAVERQLGVLVDAGFEAQDALLALITLGAFVVGEVLDTQADRDRDPPVDPELQRRIGAGDLPLLHSAVRARHGVADDRFEYGLTTVMTGLRARLDAGVPG